MYMPCHDLEKACTFLCPGLLANTATGRNFASCVALGRNFGVTFRVAPRLRAAPPYRLRAEGAELRAGGGHAFRRVAPKFLPRATQDAKFLPPRLVWTVGGRIFCKRKKANQRTRPYKHLPAAFSTSSVDEFVHSSRPTLDSKILTLATTAGMLQV